MRSSHALPLIVVDADVASFLFNHDRVRSRRYSAHLESYEPVLPFAAVAELHYGAELRHWGAARRLELERFIREFEIEYPTYAHCEVWAEVRVAAREQGTPIEGEDAWIAATAIYLDAPLVTHNARHYRDVPGLVIINEPD